MAPKTPHKNTDDSVLSSDSGTASESSLPRLLNCNQESLWGRPSGPALPSGSASPPAPHLVINKRIIRNNLSKFKSCPLPHFYFFNLFEVEGFSTACSENHPQSRRQLSHNAAREVLSRSQVQKHLVSGCNGAWQNTWHTQSSTKVSAWSQQSQPVCMRWDHCAACFF